MKSVILWTLALLLTLGSALYQKKTGPTWPLEGSVVFDKNTISYHFLTSHSTSSDQKIELTVPDTSVSGTLYFRRTPSFESWQNQPLTRRDSLLYACLPKQKAAGKLEYRIELQKAEQSILLPPKKSVITRFKDNVPVSILLPHVLFIFLAMLLSTRTGLEALKEKPLHLHNYTLVTVALMAIGGLVFGALVQKAAFGHYWAGIPVGTDLTDNKTLIAFLAWIVALVKIRKSKNAKRWVLVAAVITFIIFIIPHSMMGSEIDYTKPEMQNTLPD
jgi:hypothetical protein